MRLVRIVGVLLILLGASCLVWFGRFWLSPDSPEYVWGPQPPHPSAVIFIGVVSPFYVATGVGILAQARWGYGLLKAFLYFCLLGFPIGTLLSWLMLRHMRRPDVRRHFGFADV